MHACVGKKIRCCWCEKEKGRKEEKEKERKRKKEKKGKKEKEIDGGDCGNGRGHARRSAIRHAAKFAGNGKRGLTTSGAGTAGPAERN